MVYKLLLNIGSFIITIFLSASYIRSLKRLENTNIRQKIFMLLIVLGIISMIMDVLEVVFFNYKIRIPFCISWYMHWLSAYGFYFMVLYYFIIYFKLENPKTWKDVFLDKKIFSLKNMYTLFIIIVFILVLVIVTPINFSETFEFVPFKYGIFILVSMAFYATYLVAVIIKFTKTKETIRKMFQRITK